MLTKVQTLRSSVPNNRPAAGSQAPGVLYVNFADLQLGVINTAGDPQDLIAIRFHSDAANYAAGDMVVVDGVIYRALSAVSAGVFNAAQWQAISGYAPPTYTPKSVLFAGAAGAPTEDNPNLHFDDAKDMLSVAGVGVGRGGGNIATNTVVGAGALAVNTTGANNVAVGDSALAANTGSANTAVGSGALA